MLTFRSFYCSHLGSHHDSKWILKIFIEIHMYVGISMFILYYYSYFNLIIELNMSQKACIVIAEQVIPNKMIDLPI